MAGPSWLAGTFAALMIVIAVYCVGRLVASRRWQRQTEADADGLHAVMGVAMAGMLVPPLSLLPGRVWEVVFGVAAAWFAWQAARARHLSTAGSWRCPYPVPHMVECAVMLYMLLAVPGSRPRGLGTGMPMPGMSTSPGAGGSFLALTVILALFMIGYVAWTADRLTSMAAAKPAMTARNTAYWRARVPVTSGTLADASPQVPADAVGTSQEHPVNTPILAPRQAAFYKIAMGVAMCYMLILML